MSEREGGGVSFRNGMLIVEEEQIGYCCRDLTRWCTIRYREEDADCVCFHCMSVCLRVVDQGIYK